MTDESIAADGTSRACTARKTLGAALVYGMACLCLAVGLGMGYLVEGWQSTTPSAQPSVAGVSPSLPPSATAGRGLTPDFLRATPTRTPMAAGKPTQTAGSATVAGDAQTANTQPSAAGRGMGHGHLVKVEQLKQLADKQAAPTLAKLQSDPNNTTLLMQAGAIYYSMRQYRDANIYYGKAVQADEKNVAFRVKLAASVYSSGDADGAIAELNRALSYDPKDADALFDLGLIRLQGKQDGKGALAAWQQLLKSNPQLSADHKATVEKLMANVLTTLGNQGIEGGRSNDAHKSSQN